MHSSFDDLDFQVVPVEERVSLAVCRTAGCSWEGIRFPITGLEHANVHLLCGGTCEHVMSMEYGEPHPVVYLDALLEEADTHA